MDIVAYGQFFTAVGDLDLVVCLPYVGIIRIQHHQVVGKLENYPAVAFAGDYYHPSQGVKNLIPAELQQCSLLRGNHAAVIRIFGIDKTDLDGEILVLHDEHAVVDADLHFLFLFRYFPYLQHPLARNDHPFFQGHSAGGTGRSQGLRQAVSVRGHHLQANLVAGAVGLEEDAVQVHADLVGGHGKSRLADQIGQHRAGHLVQGNVVRLHHLGILIRRQPRDPVNRLIASHRHLVLFIFQEMDGFSLSFPNHFI